MRHHALPPELRAAVAAQLGCEVTTVRGVSGGCISTVLQLELADGGSVFAKLAPAHAPGAALLTAEQWGLAALRETQTVRVPAEIAVGRDWLLLEWLEPGRGDAARWRSLGAALARLHRVRAERFGADRDNYIGSLSQRNTQHPDWAAFWWQERLEPQLERAVAAGHVGATLRAELEQLRPRLDEVLAPGQEEGASLLHGDLWGGNVQMVQEGEAALIDPSCYYGHREVDLAMAALFGGFDAQFWDAYGAEWPLVQEGFERRRAIYQLYYLLVHVNLFGGSYLAQTAAALRTALR